MENALAAVADLDDIPAFDRILHVGFPNIGDRRRLRERIDSLLDRRWLSNNGPFVQELEARIAEMVGVKHCIAACNATVALQIVAKALGLRGEVIIPSFTFIATAHALQWQEITPVFCDIDPETHNIDPRRIRQMITPRTTGIIGVHLWGRPCSVEALETIAREHGLKLIFDAAHAIGCSHRGRMIGGFGDAEVFSFHATKFLNAFEGGAVVTNDDALAAIVRLMVNFGFAGHDQVICVGTNGKMTEVAAAMGLTSLESREEFVDSNRRNHADYRQAFAGIPGIDLLTFDDSERCNYQYVVAEVDERTACLPRDTLVKVLHSKNVIARRYFYPGCHRMEPYRTSLPHAGLTLPQTEKIAGRVLVLPTGPTVRIEDIRKIAQIIGRAVERARATRDAYAEVQAESESASRRVLVGPQPVSAANL